MRDPALIREEVLTFCSASEEFTIYAAIALCTGTAMFVTDPACHGELRTPSSAGAAASRKRKRKQRERSPIRNRPAKLNTNGRNATGHDGP